ncbi:MAG TPA: Hpt domain-containing protein [Pyrinomonadaceae bacterium]|nr:Hpt domain-containing protein [Pyrinomonadaceae bacterium]
MSLTNTMVECEAVVSVDLSVLAGFDEVQEEGEPDFVVELIELYLSEAPGVFSTIQEGLTNNDWLSAKRAAHSLRGSSSNLGILQMAQISDELEHLTNNQQVHGAELLELLRYEFTRVEEILLAERQRRLS